MTIAPKRRREPIPLNTRDAWRDATARQWPWRNRDCRCTGPSGPATKPRIGRARHNGNQYRRSGHRRAGRPDRPDHRSRRGPARSRKAWRPPRLLQPEYASATFLPTSGRDRAVVRPVLGNTDWRRNRPHAPRLSPDTARGLQNCNRRVRC